MANETITINGIAYSAKDIEIIMLGRITRGITELNFSEDNDSEGVYVFGTNKKVDHIRGKENCKADITMLMNEVAGIEIAADGSITSLGDFDIQVLFKALPVPMKITLRGCQTIGKAMGASAGSAQALAFKINMDVLEIKPLKAA
jgi:hypothetical protein